jgi:plastocyanin
MSRTRAVLLGLAALLALSACTPGEPAVAVNDQVPAANRTDAAPEEGAGEEGEGGGGGQIVAFAASTQLAYTEAPTEVPAGPSTFQLTCDSLPHNVVLEELGDDLIVECEGEGEFTGDVDLEPGTYTYYCSIAGHREAGMEGQFTAA